jgi:hypothetical protein
MFPPISERGGIDTSYENGNGDGNSYNGTAGYGIDSEGTNTTKNNTKNTGMVTASGNGVITVTVKATDVTMMSTGAAGGGGGNGDRPLLLEKEYSDGGR